MKPLLLLRMGVSDTSLFNNCKDMDKTDSKIVAKYFFKAKKGLVIGSRILRAEATLALSHLGTS